MIGNDIVDLTEAKQKSNWQRTGFLDKLFTDKEQHLIQNTMDPFLMVWRLWSMKEAAYKLYTQIYPSRFYNPKAFECKIKDLKGYVQYLNFRYYTTTRITSDFILTEARVIRTDFSSKIVVFSSVKAQIQRNKLKTELLKEVAKHYAVKVDALTFRKNQFNIPTVYFGTNKCSVSLAHHGRFGTFGF